MSYQIHKVNGDYTYLSELPDQCPWCHKSVQPNLITAYIREDYFLEAHMYCPNKKCGCSFIGYYYKQRDNYYNYDYKTTVGNLIGKQFETSIAETSSSFISIYNEAYIAEQEGLTQICGVGYRKALEFLIKDYVIQGNEDKKDEILKMQLGACINKYVTDVKVKSVSKRAAWLGNDETHYVRKWESKNLQDLKKLIDLVVHWIEMEKLTEGIETDMPETKPNPSKPKSK